MEDQHREQRLTAADAECPASVGPESLDSESGLTAGQAPQAVDANSFIRLLAEAQNGSVDALGQLVKANQNYLLLIANQEIHANVQAKVGASDVVQETLAAAHRNFEQFQGKTAEEWRGWLRVILKNQLLATTRQFAAAKRDIQREGPLADAERMKDQQPTPRTTALQADEALRLRRAMERLSEDHRRVIMLHKWEQLSFREVSQQMNRSEDAVKKLWSRALRSLKVELIREEQQGPG